jgi:hypothetical protein
LGCIKAANFTWSKIHKDNPFKIDIDIKTDKAFNHSRAVLESKRKHLKGEGKGSKKNNFGVFFSRFNIFITKYVI